MTSQQSQTHISPTIWTETHSLLLNLVECFIGGHLVPGPSQKDKEGPDREFAVDKQWITRATNNLWKAPV